MELEQARQFREQLLQLLAQLRAEGDVPVALEAASPVASDVDEDEQPYREMSQVLASNRNRERTQRLRGIEDALRRLDQSPEDFGICEGCSDDISERRLLLMPWTRLCVSCQTDLEAGRTRHTRKKVTDYR